MINSIWQKSYSRNFIFLIKSLACYNYTGYNCQYEIFEDDVYETEFDTGLLVCKKPEDCLGGLLFL